MSFASSNISPMMQSLNQQATEKARLEIARKFADQHDLDEIPSYAALLQKQLQTASAQLDGAVQGKLDALKRAVDLMDESAAKLSNFTQNMKRVDDRICQTNTAIASFENLKRVHNVRDNLQRVISQIDYFANVPKKERMLRQILESDHTKLREVFLESLKLDSLRIALMNEIRENERDLREFVDQFLHVVPVLAADVAEKALSNISGFMDATGRERDFYDLALDSPADLVASFEVIQMHQEYFERRKTQIIRKIKSAKSSIPLADQLEVFDVYNLQEKARARLKQRMSFRIEICFDAILREYTAEKKSVTAAVLDAGSELIKLFVDIINDVDPCIPPEYETIFNYFTVFDFHLQPRIEQLAESVRTLTVGEIINIVDWLKYFNSQMERFELGDQPCCERYEQLANDLMREYLDRIKAQVMRWFDNIRKQELEIVEAGDKTLITSNPEDMFNVIHSQLAVAKENLPPECLKDVVVSCIEVLREVQGQSREALVKNWRSLTPETMCSTVNDNQRMQEKCEEFKETVLSLIPSEKDKDMLTEQLEVLAREYVAIALTACGFIARVVLDDLEADVFSQLFSPAWENGEQLIAIAIATMRDYNSDFCKWLTEYFYCKYLYELMVNCIGTYAMALRRFPPGSFKFVLEFKAAKTIIDDAEALGNFFDSYSDQIFRSAGTSSSSSSPIVDELSLLRALSMIVSASHISSIEVQVKLFFTKWGADGLKLVQSAINSNPNISKPDRQEMLEAAAGLFAKKSSGQYATTPSDQFRNVADSHIDAMAAAKPVKTKTRMFWG